MTDQTQARASFAKVWTQAVLGVIARGWNGPPAADTPDDAPTAAWEPRPDILFQATRAAFKR